MLSPLAESLLSGLKLDPGRLFGKIEIRHADEHAAGIRVFMAYRSLNLWLDISPRDESSPFFVQTPSFNLIYSKISREDEEEIRASLRDLAAHIGSHDDGRWRRFKHRTARRTEKTRLVSPQDALALLGALPGGSEPLAAAFRESVGRLMREDQVRPDTIEASLDLKSETFRALVNAASGARGAPDYEEATLALSAALGLESPRLRAAMLGWVEDPGKELYLGVACGPSERRQKVYFGIERFSLSQDFPGILRQIEAPSSLTKELDKPDSWRLEIVAIDFQDGTPVSYKVYWNVAEECARERFASGKLLPFLSAEGLPLASCPLMISRRFDAAGAAQDESLYAFVDPSPAQGLARRFALHCAAPLEPRWLDLSCHCLSEKRDREDGRHAYFSPGSAR